MNSGDALPRWSGRLSELRDLIPYIGICIKRIDSRRPRAASYQPGIGPHKESDVVALLAAELALLNSGRYAARLAVNAKYPNATRRTCDLCIGKSQAVGWSIEFKQLRMLGDNGKSNDNMVAHILSPYEQDRSALTDCTKLVNSGFAGRKAIVIFVYDYSKRPMERVMEAFETLSQRIVHLGPRVAAHFSDLVHPVHSEGRVFGWEVSALG